MTSFVLTCGGDSFPNEFPATISSLVWRARTRSTAASAMMSSTAASSATAAQVNQVDNQQLASWRIEVKTAGA